MNKTLPSKLDAQFRNLRQHLPRAPMWGRHLPVAAQAKALPILETGGVLGIDDVGPDHVLSWEDWLISLGWRHVSDATLNAIMGYGWAGLQVALLYGLTASVTRWAKARDLELLPTARAALGGPYPPVLSQPIAVALIRGVRRNYFAQRHFIQGCQEGVRYEELVGEEG